MVMIIDNVVVEFPETSKLVKVQPDAIRSRLTIEDSVSRTGHLM